MPVMTSWSFLAPLVAIALTAAPTSATAAQESLKIAVIDGEAGVNIIQQRTAVAPVVELRDRNNLPIAGVPVTFTLGGTNATFAGGLQTVTVTTNAAGRAIAAVNPLASGSVQINVTAAYQGQTASAVITQTNFATTQAAQAAGAISQGGQTSATTAGSGATGGGGFPSLAVAGVAGAAVAVGLAIAKATGGGQAPGVAGVSANPSAVLVGMDQQVTFSATATDPDGDTLTFRWDFGDGEQSSAATPSHVYRTEGSFTVRLTVGDGKHESTGQTTVIARTLTGTWRSNAAIELNSFGAVVPVFTITQSGTILSAATPLMTGSRGVFDACGGYQGRVQTASPRVSLTAAGCTGTAIDGRPVTILFSDLLVDPGTGTDILIGVWGRGAVYPLTLIRQ